MRDGPRPGTLSGVVRGVQGPLRYAAPMLRPALLLLCTVVLVLSGIGPYDRFTWWLEVLPGLIVLPILLRTHRRFPLTDLVTIAIAVHACILFVGGHWTYARVPAGDWVRDWLSLERNPYDRLGHLAQGFIPALVARELLLRTSPLRRGKWLFTLVTCMCLAISAFYELIEWWAAVGTGEAADDFLGTQGDVWDTQWDMFLALLGAISAQLLLSRVHDRQLEAVAGSRG